MWTASTTIFFEILGKQTTRKLLRRCLVALNASAISIYPDHALTGVQQKNPTNSHTCLGDSCEWTSSD